jgi:hypothetical protein
LAAGNRPAAKGVVRLPTEKAKEKVLDLLSRGEKVEVALSAAGMSSRSTYDRWRREDSHFRKEADFAIQRSRGGAEKRPVPDFETFARDYLGEQLFRHQLQWVDVVEGREPRDLHGSQIYHCGRPTRVLVNTPPGHSKSTTLTMNYVTWRIVQNPNLRVMIVSKTQEMSKKFLFGIKSRLNGPRYRQLQMDFGPAEGFEGSALVWAATQITLGEKDDGQKDPTVEAVGMGGQIYGARADLIIVDDAIVLANAHEYEKQALWLRQEVVSRLAKNGTILVVGTRVAQMDLYKHLREDARGVWTYLSQPAVLEFADDPADWVTLWPRSNVPAEGDEELEPDADGLFPRWDGPAMALVRDDAGPLTWELAHMQADVQVSAVFPERSVLASQNGRRIPGPLQQGNPHHPEQGMLGMYRICSMDPALSGSCAAIAYAVDRTSGKRFVLDVFNRAGMTPQGIHEQIRVWTDRYSPHEWRIEKNAMQGMITQDQVLREWLAQRGVQLREHYTGREKWDAEFGVASMASLFPRLNDAGEVVPGSGLIELPSSRSNEAVNQLMSQLIAWSPSQQGQKMRPGSNDIVMALWFAEIRARELVTQSSPVTHLQNRWLSRKARAGRMTVDIEQAIAAAQDQDSILL